MSLSLLLTAPMPCLTGNGPLLSITTHGHTDDVRARRVPVSAFWRYRISLQRKKRCQQIIGLDDESLSVALCIDGSAGADRASPTSGANSQEVDRIARKVLM